MFSAIHEETSRRKSSRAGSRATSKRTVRPPVCSETEVIAYGCSGQRPSARSRAGVTRLPLLPKCGRALPRILGAEVELLKIAFDALTLGQGRLQAADDRFL